jgi:hypothetical protein
VRREGILTAIQKKTNEIFREIPYIQFTLMRGIVWGCSLLCFTKEVFLFGFPRQCRKSFGRVEETIIGISPKYTQRM